MTEFEGKVAVVTGAASGIGRALAAAFAARGMKVVLADVERDALERAAEEIGVRGTAVLPVLTDVGRAEEVARLAERTLEAFGAVHVVCNNAGVFAGGFCWEAPIEDYEWVIGVNLWGVIHGIRTFVPILLEQDCEAHVVNTASMAAVTSGPLSAIYNLSKHAVLSLTESLYHELAMRAPRIGVTVVCPSSVDTRIADAARNRPDRLTPAGAAPSVEGAFVEQTLRDYTSRGAKPQAFAERVVEAIEQRRFYVLSDDLWKQMSETWLDDIRLRRNPTYSPPADAQAME